MEIGDVIKQQRKAAGLTQEALAKKIGCATITIRQYEAGKREPNFNTLLDIAAALNLDIFDLLPDSPTPKDPFAGLSEDEKEYVIQVSCGNEKTEAILTTFLRLSDNQKIWFLRELKRLSREYGGGPHAVDPKEDN